MGDFKDSETALVADVDCTAAGQDLCSEVGVRGYPTIKWGDPADLQDYQGGRSYDDLKSFADENLKPVCSPKNIDLCDDEKKAEIEKFQAMSADDLDSAISDKEKELADADKLFEDEVEKLQKKYKSLMEEKDAAIKAVKDSGLGLMKAVKATAGKAKDEL